MSHEHGARSRQLKKSVAVNFVTVPVDLSLQPLLVEIDQVWNALNIIAVRDSHRALSFFQSRCDRIAPTKFGNEIVPEKNVAFVWLAAFFKTPRENFFVSAAFLDALD